MHPITERPLRLTADGEQFLDIAGSVVFTKRDGCLDFLCDDASRGERAFYDQRYEMALPPLDHVHFPRLWRIDAALAGH